MVSVVLQVPEPSNPGSNASELGLDVEFRVSRGLGFRVKGLKG